MPVKRAYDDVGQIKYANAGVAIAANSVIPMVGRCAITLQAIANGASGWAFVRGLWEVPADNATPFAQDDELFWDATAGRAYKTQSYSAVGAAAPGNTGNGVLGAITLGDAAIDEVWTLTCTAAAADAGTFSVIGSKSGRTADLTVGVAYDNGFFAVTLADGAADFVVGDTFTITITAGRVRMGRAAAAKLAAGTTVVVDLNAA